MSSEAVKYRGIDNVVPPNKIVRWTGERLTDVFLSDVEVGGVDNFREAECLAQERGTGITMAGNHLSNADWYVVKRAQRKSGEADPDGKFIPMLGIRLYNHPVTRFSLKAAPHVKVWPPTETPKNPEEEELAMSLNMSALRTQKRILKEGLNVLVFPQGGREPHEITRIPEPQLAGFLDSGVVLPFGLLTDGILKKGQWIPRRNSASLNYGKPFVREELDAAFGDMDKTEMRIAKVVYVMACIAALLPEEYQGVYGDEVGMLNEGAAPQDLVKNKVEEKSYQIKMRNING